MKYFIGWYSGSTHGTLCETSIKKARKRAYAIARGNATPGANFGYSIFSECDELVYTATHKRTNKTR